MGAVWFDNFVFMIVLFCLGLESLTWEQASWWAGRFIRCLFLYSHFRRYYSWDSSYWYRSRSAIFGCGTTRRYFRNHERINWIIACNQLGIF